MKMISGYKRTHPNRLATGNEFAASAPKEKTNWRLLPEEILYERYEIFQGFNLGKLKNMLSESLTNMNGRNPYDNNSKKEKEKTRKNSIPVQASSPITQEKAKKKTHFTHFPIVTM